MNDDGARGPALMDDKESTSLRLRLRQILRTPIGSVQPDTLVKVRGRMSLRGPALAAPIAGTPCAVYCVDAVDTPLSLHLGGGQLPPNWTGEDPGTWKVSRLPREIGGIDLILEDGTAHALVHVDGAQVSLLGNWTTSLATTQARFLISRGRPPPRPPEDPDQARYLEYRELTIVPGELVTVFGRAHYGADPRPRLPGPPAYRGSHHRCVFTATPASPLYIIQERVMALDAVG